MWAIRAGNRPLAGSRISAIAHSVRAHANPHPLEPTLWAIRAGNRLFAGSRIPAIAHRVRSYESRPCRSPPCGRSAQETGCSRVFGFPRSRAACAPTRTLIRRSPPCGRSAQEPGCPRGIGFARSRTGCAPTRVVAMFGRYVPALVRSQGRTRCRRSVHEIERASSIAQGSAFDVGTSLFRHDDDAWPQPPIR